MKLNYIDSCFSNSITIDETFINKDNKEEHKELLKEVALKILNNMDHYEFIADYLYDNSTNLDGSVCEQCGHYNLDVNLEI